MINQRTLTLTVYNVHCSHCGAQGPDGISEVDAHHLARQTGWEIIEDSYICPDSRQVEQKKMRELPQEIRVEHDSTPLVSWWR